VRNIEIINGSRDTDGTYFGHIKGVPKPKELIEKTMAAAESRGADFTGITIKSSDYHDESSYGFILIGRPVIYLQGVDLIADCAWYSNAIRGLYEKLNIDGTLADRANNVVESIVRTLLHEYCHLKTLDVMGDYLAGGFDSRFTEYIDHVAKMRKGGPEALLQLDDRNRNGEIGEWIAEDYRLLLDPNSPYHNSNSITQDLLYPYLAADRRDYLKGALGL